MTLSIPQPIALYFAVSNGAFPGSPVHLDHVFHLQKGAKIQSLEIR